MIFVLTLDRVPRRMIKGINTRVTTYNEYIKAIFLSTKKKDTRLPTLKYKGSIV